VIERAAAKTLLVVPAIETAANVILAIRDLRKLVATIVMVATTILKLAITLCTVPVIATVTAANLVRTACRVVFPTIDIAADAIALKPIVLNAFSNPYIHASREVFIVATALIVAADNLVNNDERTAFPTTDKVAVLIRVWNAFRIAFPTAVIELL
jgi:mannose/fructose/N-acetylgalactosamine-specific phosphotransferase system component IIC